MLLGAFVSTMVLASVPLAFATTPTPADASIIVPATSCGFPSCLGFDATLSVAQNDQCPSGGTYTGYLVRSGPQGSGTGPVGPISCGDTVAFIGGAIHPVYPENGCDLPFAGTYNFEFYGETQDAAGAPVASFDVKNSYTVLPCVSVPQFPLGMTVLFALTVPTLILVKRGLSRPRAVSSA
jgi:hypothetical protein